MKTVKKSDAIKRVKDSEASKFIIKGWAYCSKGEWKNRKVKEVKEKEVVKGEKVEEKEEESKYKKKSRKK